MVWGTGLIKGMAVTLKNSFRGPVTINYPDERFELPERARWAVDVILDDEGAPKCTACMNCVRECPDDVLSLEVETVETDDAKLKRITSFTYEVGACMFCGLCVEKCPFSALEMTHEYELATTETASLTTVLLEDVMAASAKRKAKPKPEAEGGESDA